MQIKKYEGEKIIKEFHLAKSMVQVNLLLLWVKNAPKIHQIQIVFKCWKIAANLLVNYDNL